MRRRVYSRWLLLAICSIVGSGAVATPTADLTIAAAVSLREVMPELVEAYKSQHGGEVTVTYGASGKLRRQIEAGAPIDVFISASAAHVDKLHDQGLVAGQSRRVVASNVLVLVGPRGGDPLSFSNIETVPADENIAIGDPESVPAGHYARDALRALGKWERVQPRLVYGGHVAAVLQYVRRGEVMAGVVYATDVREVEDVVVLDTAVGNWAPTIETVAVAIDGASDQGAAGFVEFLASREVTPMFVAHGFRPPAKAVAEAAP